MNKSVQKKLNVITAVILGFTVFYTLPSQADHAVGHDSTARLNILEMQAAIEALTVRVTTLEAQIEGLSNVTALENRITAVEDTLICVSYDSINQDFIFEGCNVHVRDGSGATESLGTGLGNLIVGYDEALMGNDKTGSHNLVIGRWHDYPSYGGFVTGINNKINGPYASVSGGQLNIASGSNSSISGGSFNTASGNHSSVSGGNRNTASGDVSSVSGGVGNTASGIGSSVSGGDVNTASGRGSSISGGNANMASGFDSSVSGGQLNTASSSNSSVSGGQRNTASGNLSSVSGGQENAASGLHSSVSGGSLNTAIGESSSVSGGASRNAGAINSWAAGSLFETN